MDKMARETVVVTGVSSFIGVHVASTLAKAGYNVVGTTSKPISTYETIRRHRIMAAGNAGVELRLLDITNSEDVRAFILGEKPYAWIQHAGFAENYAGLDYDIERGHAINIAPLTTLYSALSMTGCHGVVITGSMAEYSDSSGEKACIEEDACWPSTPYGLSKLAETIRARQLAYQFGLKTRVARVFIPYGPMDAPGKLLPSVIEALRMNRKVDLSSGEQKRDFIHVADLAKGYVALLKDLNRDSLFELFNLCSGEGHTVREVLLTISDLLQADSGLLRFGRRPLRPGEAPVCFGSDAKARSLLDWRPRVIEEGLRAYVHEGDSGHE